MSRAQKLLNLCNQPPVDCSLQYNLDLNDVLHHLPPFTNNQTQVCLVKEKKNNILQSNLDSNNLQILQPLTNTDEGKCVNQENKTNSLKFNSSFKRRLFQDILPKVNKPRLDDFNKPAIGNLVKDSNDLQLPQPFTNREKEACVNLEKSPNSLKFNSDPELIKKEINNRITELKKLKEINEKDGRRSAARRKQRKIKCLEILSEKLIRGEFVGIDELTPLIEDTPPKNDPKVRQAVNVCDIENSSLKDTETLIETVNVCDMENSSLMETEIMETEIIEKGKRFKRKENYCILCKKCVKEFCKHYENVHKNTPEGLKLKELNQITDKVLRKKLKTEVTDSLRKEGNSELTKLNVSKNIPENEIIIVVKRSSKAVVNNSSLVQCTHCKGYYKRRKFSQHLHFCKKYLEFRLTDGKNIQGCDALKLHALPFLPSVNGATKQLLNEVILNMKDKKTKDIAIKDTLIMKYASEFHKTRRAPFQKNYVARVITDLARILMRMREFVGEEITCLEDVFNPKHFSKLVECILAEGGYNEDTGKVKICGLANRLRSHIKGAAETAKRYATEAESVGSSPRKLNLRKSLKHFLTLLSEKWANEVGRIFDESVKMSRSETEKKLAVEEDIVTTCEYICSKYRTVISEVKSAPPGSATKQNKYNTLLDLLVTHIMCLIRRRPVDFKRGLNLHYDKINEQEDLISEVKNSKYMSISDEDMKVCSKFKLFYVPGKGWKELVPIALTKVMKEAMDCIQSAKQDVGITSELLFIRARNMPINPRESMKKVTKHLKLKKPLDMSGNGLRHHAGTWSKLHSSHPQYQDYLASALGHTLHIHKLHYEMPTSILQKLIVCPVLHNMTKSNSNTGNCDDTESYSTDIENEVPANFPDIEPVTPKKYYTDFETEKTSDMELSNTYNGDSGYGPGKTCNKLRWTYQEKKVIYKAFGNHILEKSMVPRCDVVQLLENHKELFKSRSVHSVVTFVNNQVLRKQKNVSPDVKNFLLKTHRKVTNVPI